MTMEFLRTDDSCFADLDGYSFAPNYLLADDTEGAQLRVHYVDEGPKNFYQATHNNLSIFPSIN